MQVPPTFRTKLYGPRKTIGHAKEQIRAQARNAARNRQARTQSTIKELNAELVRSLCACLRYVPLSLCLCVWLFVSVCFVCLVCVLSVCA